MFVKLVGIMLKVSNVVVLSNHFHQSGLATPVMAKNKDYHFVIQYIDLDGYLGFGIIFTSNPNSFHIFSKSFMNV